MNLRKTVVFFPFAFGGNPATASGPRCIHQLLSDLKTSADLLIFEQQFEESAKDYLSRLQTQLGLIIDNSSIVIVIGGNHLSTLPVYKLIYGSSKSIITLDAHRDYFPQDEINHATFLRQVESNKCKHILLGARDFHLHSCTHANICSPPETDFSFIDHFLEKKVDYLDIDVDVIDPTIFSWCGSVLDGGYSIEDVLRIIEYSKEKGCTLFSLSEYIPNFDTGLAGAQLILHFIQKMLT